MFDNLLFVSRYVKECAYRNAEYNDHNFIKWICFKSDNASDWFIEDLYSYNGFLTEC
jgi:hypothetical protein